MTGDDAKDVLRGAASNSTTIVGYISISLTFLPVMAGVGPYMRLLGVLLILVGAFRGAKSVIAAKEKWRETAEFLERQRQTRLDA